MKNTYLFLDYVVINGPDLELVEHEKQITHKNVFFLVLSLRGGGWGDEPNFTEKCFARMARVTCASAPFGYGSVPGKNGDAILYIKLYKQKR